MKRAYSRANHVNFNPSFLLRSTYWFFVIETCVKQFFLWKNVYCVFEIVTQLTRGIVFSNISCGFQ